MKIKIHKDQKKEIKKYLNGENIAGYKIFGAIKSGDGYIFRLYAPFAQKVFLKGDFNNWQEEEMFKNPNYGYFYLYKKAKIGDYYKFAIEKNGRIIDHADPFARKMDPSGDFATKICDYKFEKKENFFENSTKKLKIYSLDLLNYYKFQKNLELEDIAYEILNYLKKNSYNCLCIKEIREVDDYSYKYKIRGLFALNNNICFIEDLRDFIKIFKENNIIVLLNFSFSKFSNSKNLLLNFDFKNLYERKYQNKNDEIFLDFSKGHVRSFIGSSINYWIKILNFDGVIFDNLDRFIVDEENYNFIKNLEKILKKENQKIKLIGCGKNIKEDISFDLSFDTY